jgi:hypothetical protein
MITIKGLRVVISDLLMTISINRNSIQQGDFARSAQVILVIGTGSNGKDRLFFGCNYHL